MKPDFSVKDAVIRRYSVRTYENRPVEKELQEKIMSYANKLENPLGPGMRIQMIEKESAANGEKLGTYGVIKGAGCYLAATIPNEKYAQEALGYEFEQLVLYAASLGLGTCWLGGTFNRSAFAAAIEIGENEIFPILSPLGYPAQKKSFTEQIMRKSVKADKRLPWKELFFRNDFSTPVSEEEAGEYRFPLEMVRLAPSAVNKQPWRVIISEGAVHFYEKRSMPAEAGTVDMQRIDVGIAVCHFHLAAEEMNLKGHFERKDPGITGTENVTYITSWIRE